MRRAGRWVADHPVFTWLTAISLIGAVAFAVAFQQINEANRASDRKTQTALQELAATNRRLAATNAAIIATGNEAIVQGCQRNNRNRDGTAQFLATFADAARRALADPNATPDVRARALATLAANNVAVKQYRINVPLENCVGPLKSIPTLP